MNTKEWENALDWKLSKMDPVVMNDTYAMVKLNGQVISLNSLDESVSLTHGRDEEGSALLENEQRINV